MTEPLNMHGHANTWEEELIEVCAERDALRAENERLHERLDTVALKLGHAHAENERLTVELTHRVGWEERALRAEALLRELSGQMDRDMGSPREGKLSDLRRRADRYVANDWRPGEPDPYA